MLYNLNMILALDIFDLDIKLIWRYWPFKQISMEHQ